MKLYPLGDWPNREECEALGANFDRRGVVMPSKGQPARWLRAVTCRIYRCPKKGEWYISGANPHAYRAGNDFTSKYQIAQLVRTRTVAREIIEATIS